MVMYKRHVVVISAAAVGFVLTGCGNGENKNKNGSEDQSSSSGGEISDDAAQIKQELDSAKSNIAGFPDLKKLPKALEDVAQIYHQSDAELSDSDCKKLLKSHEKFVSKANNKVKSLRSSSEILSSAGKLDTEFQKMCGEQLGDSAEIPNLKQMLEQKATGGGDEGASGSGSGAGGRQNRIGPDHLPPNPHRKPENGPKNDPRKEQYTKTLPHNYQEFVDLSKTTLKGFGSGHITYDQLMEVVSFKEESGKDGVLALCTKFLEKDLHKTLDDKKPLEYNTHMKAAGMCGAILYQVNELGGRAGGDELNGLIEHFEPYWQKHKMSEGMPLPITSLSDAEKEKFVKQLRGNLFKIALVPFNFSNSFQNNVVMFQAHKKHKHQYPFAIPLENLVKDADMQDPDGDLDRMFQKHKKDRAAAGAVHGP